MVPHITKHHTRGPDYARGPDYDTRRAIRPLAMAACRLQAIPGRNGFSLIEMMVSLSIVVLLIAILLPVLGTVKRSAERASDLADIRQHAAIIALYCDDHAGKLPNYIDPETGIGPLPESSVEALRYFDQVAAWTIPLLERYYNTRTMNNLFYISQSEGGIEHTFGGVSSYILSATFLATPEYWKPETRRPPPIQLSTLRLDQVSLPSSKALIDAVPIHDTDDPANTRIRVGFVDGSALIIARNKLNNGYPTGPGFYEPWADGPYPITVTAYTIGGVFGIDYSR